MKREHTANLELAFHDAQPNVRENGGFIWVTFASNNLKATCFMSVEQLRVMADEIDAILDALPVAAEIEDTEAEDI